MRKTLFILFIIFSVLQILSGLYIISHGLNFILIHFAGLAFSLIYILMNMYYGKSTKPFLLHFLQFFFIVFIGLEICWIPLLAGIAIFLGSNGVNLFFYLILVLLILHVISALWLNRKINSERNSVLASASAIEA